jgi:hypothetical protein
MPRRHHLRAVVASTLALIACAARPQAAAASPVEPLFDTATLDAQQRFAARTPTSPSPRICSRASAASCSAATSESEALDSALGVSERRGSVSLDVFPVRLGGDVFRTVKVERSERGMSKNE